MRGKYRHTRAQHTRARAHIHAHASREQIVVITLAHKTNTHILTHFTEITFVMKRMKHTRGAADIEFKVRVGPVALAPHHYQEEEENNHPVSFRHNNYIII